jgi:hypothetical protein
VSCEAICILELERAACLPWTSKLCHALHVLGMSQATSLFQPKQ